MTDKHHWSSSHSSSGHTKLAGLYELKKTLGRGHFAVVKLAQHVFTGENVAIKVIDKTKLDKTSMSHINNEVICMKLVQHPNVVRLYEVIETSTKLYLILELGDGGDMYDYIMRHDQGLQDEQAKEYFAQITFADEFEIEADDIKCLDYITISDLDGKLIGHPLCDKWKPAFPIFSLGGAIVHFESDYSGNFNGFVLFYEMTDNKTVASNCQSGYLLRESGIIHSSDYPENYPSSHHCQWLLEASENKVIQLEFDPSFAIEETDGCQFDYVEMFNSDIDGRLVSSIGKLCGNLNTEQLNYQSETRWMVVKFITDTSKNAPGFVASFSSA